MIEGRSGFADEFDVSRETMEKLDCYAALLKKWNAKINLVAPKTVQNLWTRHFADSAQVFRLSPNTAQHWADLGSGGGFPGAVIAILAAQDRPEMHTTLVESDKRKSAFLRTVARETHTPISVVDQRIEEIEPLAADVLSARALAPLDALLGFAKSHLSPGGIAIFPKGVNATAEVEKARETWSFTVENHPSLTDREATVLTIGEIKRV